LVLQAWLPLPLSLLILLLLLSPVTTQRCWHFRAQG